MKLPFILLASAALLSSGGAQAQQAEQQEKQATAYLVADAHLDTQWNWDVQTTIREYVWNTLSRNLFLIKKYPDYIFNFEGGVKYSWMKEYYPAEYEQLREVVRAGRWHISGSSWDATDALVPSTESFIRNILLGQEFYRQEFGVESTDIFLPDCFGFGWTLPTVASHCGLIGFSSQKLDWRLRPFYGESKHPFTIGLWQGVDGATIMLAHGYDYGKRWESHDLSENKELLELAERSPLKTVYRYYGTGDVGGSPTLGSVSSVEKGIDGKGPLKIVSATSDRLFKEYQPYDSHPELPRFDGELLMDVHGTGCYTSQAAMKLYNRQNELLGDAAERAAFAADWLGAADYPGRSLTESWRRFIFHQFHDDLTGTSIPRAYEFSWNDELLSLKQFSDVMTASAGAVAEHMDTRVKGTPVLLYNALGYPVTDVVEIAVEADRAPRNVQAYDADGRQAAAQLLAYEKGKAHLLLEATVPANGYAVYDLRLSGSGKAAAPAETQTTVENSVYRIELDEKGDIASLFDKLNGRELVKAGRRIRLALFTENKSYNWPAWEIIKETMDKAPVSIAEEVRTTMVEQGALRKTLCVEKRYGESLFRQYIRLYEGALADRIDFFNEIDWRTGNALLKAEFPLNVENEQATYDLGIGSIRRGNNTPTAYEVYAQQWADLTDRNGGYGVSILNDSKYGWDKPDDNTLRLTLIHTPKTRNNYVYQDHQDLGYHTFTYSLVGHAGDLEKASTAMKAELLNQRVKAFAVAKHDGELGRRFSPVGSDNENVTIKALKRAESSDEYVVRVYETGGKTEQEALLTFAAEILSASEADGTEKTIGEAPFDGRRLKVAVGPNGVKTYKVRLQKREKRPMKQEPLALPFDKRCFSWNEFRWASDFEGGHSYAAELIPAELTAGRVTFRLETREEKSGLTCKGDTLLLPAGHTYNRLYLLAAAATPEKDVRGMFLVGGSRQELVVPSYTGFIGQWGHEGHTRGYLKDAEVAFAGTHRHSSEGDHPYEFTYMYKFALDIPAGATKVVLPKSEQIVLFAATAVEEPCAPAEPLSTLFRTANRENGGQEEASEPKASLLDAAQIVGWSGYANDREKPEFLVDGKEETKWCDVSMLPNYVVFDLGREKSIGGWRMVNAASESPSYVTAGCFLQGRNGTDEEWRTLDFVTGNRQNVVSRTLGKSEPVRYLRLLVTQPVQSSNGRNTRIYEFAVYE